MLIRWKSKEKSASSASSGNSKKKRKGRDGGKGSSAAQIFIQKMGALSTTPQMMAILISCFLSSSVAHFDSHSMHFVVSCIEQKRIGTRKRGVAVAEMHNSRTQVHTGRDRAIGRVYCECKVEGFPLICCGLLFSSETQSCQPSA